VNREPFINKAATIYPVVLSVPAEAQHLAHRSRGEFLSRHARCALELSAERLGIELGPLEKDDRGAPLPFNGWFWSVTHKPTYVGGVVAPGPVGIDLEPVRPCSRALFRKTASDAEWALAAGADMQHTFFRYWTAKEAVLKIGGEGIKDLARCRVTKILDDTRLNVEYAGRTWIVDQIFFDGHVAAVVTSGFETTWLLTDAAG